MFQIKASSFYKVPLEESASYEPFFAKKPRVYSSYSSPTDMSTFSPVKNVQPVPVVQPTNENIDSVAPKILEVELISSADGDSLLVDDYPDPESPYQSDSDDDRLYIDLDPPANYNRRVSVNCFTTPINKVVKSEKSSSPSPSLVEDKSSQTDLTGDEKVTKSHRSKKKKEKVTTADQGCQTELEYISPCTISTSIHILEQAKEVLRRRKRQRGRGAGRKKDRSWSRREKQPYLPEGGLRYVREEPRPKKRRHQRQMNVDINDDDSDMDPPIRTIT